MAISTQISTSGKLPHGAGGRSPRAVRRRGDAEAVPAGRAGRDEAPAARCARAASRSARVDPPLPVSSVVAVPGSEPVRLRLRLPIFLCSFEAGG
jgi:hypothetical protein